MTDLRISGLVFTRDDENWMSEWDCQHLRLLGKLGRRRPTGRCLVPVVIEGEDENSDAKPSREQEAAVRYLLRSDALVASRLMDALYRWQKATRKHEPDWFDDVPEIRSESGLGRLVELTSVTITRVPLSGVAITGFSFQCAWDAEHGFGMLMHKATVLGDWDQQSVSLSSANPFASACNARERKARDKFFETYQPSELRALRKPAKKVKSPSGASAVKSTKEKSVPSILQDLRKERVAQWNRRDFVKKATASPFVGYDLSGLKLDKVNFFELGFPKCNFDGTSFKNADLRKCDFRGATFREASLQGAQVMSAKFASCRFGGTRFGPSPFSFTDCDLRKTDFTGQNLAGVTFSMSDLRGADFSNATLKGAQLINWNRFDERTKWPSGYKLPGPNFLKWTGKGRDPRI